MNDSDALLLIHKIRDNAASAGSKETDRLYELLLGATGRAVKAAAIQALRVLQDLHEGAPIIVGSRLVQANPDLAGDAAFLMYVLDIFHVNGKGSCVVGYVSDGVISAGQKLILAKADGRDLATRCTDIHNPHGAWIKPGSQIGVFLAGLSMGEISQGDALRGS